MGEARDTKTGKLLLFIVFIGLIELFNGIVGQQNVLSQPSFAIQPSYFQSANTAAADTVAVGSALDPSSYNIMNLDDNNNNTCIPQPHCPLSRVHYVSPTSGIDYTANMTANASEAICLYDRFFPRHFPHAMQQLFGCFSFWHKHPTKKPIFAVDDKSLGENLPESDVKNFRKSLIGQRIPKNFLEMLKSQMSVQIVNMEWLEERIKTTGITPYVVHNNGFDVTPTTELHKHTAAHFHFNDTSSWTCTKSKPRIGILNRANHSYRSILNAEQIATVAKSLSRDDSIPVTYFEQFDVREQVEFFRSVDILISPHGAQLVGVAYMDAPCSHLLELFPKVSYDYVTREVILFHRLVFLKIYIILDYTQKELRNTILFWNLGNGQWEEILVSVHVRGFLFVEQAMVKKERNAARNSDLCPSIPTIVGYLQELVAEWNKCCASMRKSTY